MKNSLIKRFITGCIIVTLYILYHLYLYAAVGTTSAEFLLIPSGARPSSMGGTFVGIADDINAMGYNPAGLGQLIDREFLFMHSEWLIDTTYDYGAYAHPTQIGTFGVSFAHINAGDMTRRDNLGNKTGDFTASDIAFSVSYSISVADEMYVGFNGKYIKQTIDDAKRTGGALDVGLLWKLLPDSLYAGAVIQNIGPKLGSFDKEEETLPTTFRLGIGKYAFQDRLLLASEFKKIIHSKPSIHVGVEYMPAHLLSLRTGFESGSDKEDPFMWTAGFGFNIRNYSIDYGYEPFGDLDNTHRFSVTYKF